jgi:viologen exporter family transport system permease protein
MPTLVVYSRLVLLQIRAQMQYRWSFALSMSGTFLFTALDFAVILIVFHNIHSLVGWSAPEVALLYSAAAMSFALADIVLGSLDQLPRMIRDGSFDTLLLRPRSSLFQLLATDFMLRRAGRLIQAFIVFIVLLTRFLNVDWTMAKAIVLSSAIISGAVILGAVWICAASVCFWVDGAAEFVNVFSTGSLFFAQYPLGIYAGWLRQLVLYVVPIGFVIYMPATYILEKSAALGHTGQFASPAVAAVSVATAALFWRRGIRHYKSAGG